MLIKSHNPAAAHHFKSVWEIPKNTAFTLTLAGFALADAAWPGSDYTFGDRVSRVRQAICLLGSSESYLNPNSRYGL